jgi:hypothetical protein
MKKQTVTKNTSFYIDYKFTDQELMEKGKELAKASQQKDALELKKKEVTSQITAEIAGKNAEINIITSKINNGYENRKVEGQIEYDFEENKKYFIHDGKVHRTERMTEEDHQQELDLKMVK